VQALAVPVNLVVDHAETVTLAQILSKINVISKCVGEAKGHQVAHARLVAGIEQGAVDDAMGDFHAALEGAILDRFGDRVGGKVQGHACRIAAVEAQCPQAA
jgi:hypothetical protein